MTRRTLSLKRETLTELTAAELDAVVGAHATQNTCVDSVNVPCETPTKPTTPTTPAVAYCLTLAGPECIF